MLPLEKKIVADKNIAEISWFFFHCNFGYEGNFYCLQWANKQSASNTQNLKGKKKKHMGWFLYLINIFTGGQCWNRQRPNHKCHYFNEFSQNSLCCMLNMGSL